MPVSSSTRGKRKLATSPATTVKEAQTAAASSGLESLKAKLAVAEKEVEFANYKVTLAEDKARIAKEKFVTTKHEAQLKEGYLEDAKYKIACLQKDLKESRSTVEKLQSELASSKTGNDFLQRRSDVLQIKVEELIAIIAQQQADFLLLQGEHKESKDEPEKANLKLAPGEDNLDSLKRTVTELQRDKQDLEEDLEIHQENIASLVHDLEEYDRASERAGTKSGRTDVNLDSVKDTIIYLQRIKADLEAEVDAARAMSKLQMRGLANIEHEFKQFKLLTKEEADSADRENSDLKQKLDHALTSVQSLKAKLQESQETVKQLQDELKEIQSTAKEQLATVKDDLEPTKSPKPKPKLGDCYRKIVLDNGTELIFAESYLGSETNGVAKHGVEELYHQPKLTAEGRQTDIRNYVSSSDGSTASPKRSNGEVEDMPMPDATMELEDVASSDPHAQLRKMEAMVADLHKQKLIGKEELKKEKLRNDLLVFRMKDLETELAVLKNQVTEGSDESDKEGSGLPYSGDMLTDVLEKVNGA